MKRLFCLMLILVVIVPVSFAQEPEGIDMLQFAMLTTKRIGQVGDIKISSTYSFGNIIGDAIPHAYLFGWMVFYDKTTMNIFYGTGSFKLNWDNLEETYDDLGKLLPGFSVFEYDNDLQDQLLYHLTDYAIKLSNKTMNSIVEKIDFTRENWDKPLFIEKVGNYDLYINKSKYPDADKQFSFEFVLSGMTYEEAQIKILQ